MSFTTRLTPLSWACVSTHLSMTGAVTHSFTLGILVGCMWNFSTLVSYNMNNKTKLMSKGKTGELK
jgi:MFS superfamily sulfate permease-like transporter